MDFIENLIGIKVDPIVVVLVIAGGFWAKKYLDGWTHIRVGKWRPQFTQAWKTLIVGTIFTVIYLAIMRFTGEFKQDMVLRTFYSYTFTTSFYELILGPFIKWISSIFPGKKDDTTPPPAGPQA